MLYEVITVRLFQPRHRLPHLPVHVLGRQAGGVAGDLTDLSIVELVQMLNLNKKSGVLNIDAGIKGKVYLKDGP